MLKKSVLTVVLLHLAICCRAQLIENQGWLFVSHTQKLNSRFDLLADAQLRSGDQWNYLTTLLLRTGLNYKFNKQHSTALGYAFKGDREFEEGNIVYTRENRIYEQYMFQFKLAKTEMILRSRFEQRFIKAENIEFSQRGRIFLSAQIPLFANNDFSKGIYATAQNELFLNFTNKAAVNGSLFDQNRLLTGAGYRFNQKIDLEAGYYLWYQKEMDASYRRNVVQLMITTSF